MKDNMEELQRWENDLRYGNPLSRAEDGAWVRFSDVAERDKEARELEAERDALLRDIGRLKERKRGDKARIETLEARLEELAGHFKNMAWSARKACSESGDLKADVYRDAYQRVRSLIAEDAGTDRDGKVSVDLAAWLVSESRASSSPALEGRES